MTHGNIRMDQGRIRLINIRFQNSVAIEDEKRQRYLYLKLSLEGVSCALLNIARIYE